MAQGSQPPWAVTQVLRLPPSGRVVRGQGPSLQLEVGGGLEGPAPLSASAQPSTSPSQVSQGKGSE